MKQQWTKTEEEKVVRLALNGKPYYEIAEALGRSPASVSIKITRLKQDGKLTESKLPLSNFPVWNEPLRSEGNAVILSDVEAPYQHSEFINRVLDLADAWGIKTLHLAGDLLHYSNLSAWGSEWVQDKESMLETILDAIQDLKEKKRDEIVKKLEEKGLVNKDGLSGELTEARRVFRSFGSFDNVYVAIGNHDDRYLRALDQALSPNELLHQLDRHNDPRWKVAPYYYTLIDTQHGTYRVTHPRGAGQKAAIDLSIQFHSHVVMGHSHRWAVNRDPSGKFWAIQTGHCVDEKRLAYVMQRDAKRDAHVLGATIIRDGYPFVLCPESPWDILKRM